MMDIKTQMKILSFINKCTQNRTTPIYSNQYIPQKIDFSQFKEDVHLKKNISSKSDNTFAVFIIIFKRI